KIACIMGIIMMIMKLFQHIKNKIKIMKKFVRENLYENIETEIDPKLGPYGFDMPDTIENIENNEEDENIENELDTVDSSDMEKDEIELDDNFIERDDLKTALDLELKIKEFNRGPIEFRVIPRGEGKRGKLGEIITGIVMAKLNNDNYIFKTDNGMRKFNIKDIALLENENTSGKQLNERMKDGFEYEYVDYLFDVAGFLMLNPENVQAILNIHNVVDEEQAKIDITNELEDNESIYGVKSMFEHGIEPEDAAEKIINQYQG
ncbi:MAG: hypothetical protein WC554_18185, partial [Clostridia bacterium]